jgi:hypothetical protein
MTEQLYKVAPLTKLTLSLEAGRTQDRMDLTDGPLPFKLVYGIGKSGLTPFEYELAEKAPGDHITFSVERHQLDAFFEHALPPLAGESPVDPIHFSVRVDGISAASGKEVIQAMAAIAEGCACGCGCGHGAPHEGCSSSGCGQHS